MTNLSGSVAIVMGAGSVAPGWSNGKACAVTYARHGAQLICVDHALARAEETAHVIEHEGGRALAFCADAADEAQVAAVLDATLKAFKRIDVMHNNVGVGGAAGAPDDTSVELFDREIRQSLKSAYVGIRCAAPSMRGAGGGSILTTSSLLAVRFLSRPNVAYSSAKAAVEALTRSSAAAYGRDNIRVNCIRIGFSETPIVKLAMSTRGLSEEQTEIEMAKSRAKVPLRGEHTDPFDVAQAALFLASDAAKGITGAILNVDGGLECAPI